MSRTTMRLLAVLELLQSRDRVTGPDLSEKLDIDIRSVRRYIKQLQDIGIPVTAERGRYGAYSLDRGYKLPPLMFTEEEIVALTLGLLMVRAYTVPIDPTSVAGAFAKIERTIPGRFLDQLRELQQTIHFSNVVPPTDVREEIIEKVATAAVTRSRIQIDYDTQDDSDPRRDYDPYGIVFHDGYWYVCGYCYLKRDLTTLRIDYITAINVLEQTFTRPPDFDALKQVKLSLKQ
ncbi:MAG: WYL domain-containing protein [Chloroflexota bacterium]